MPEDVKGVIYVIEDRKIAIGVEGADVLIQKNMQGYYLVHKDDLSAMVKGIRELKAERKVLKSEIIKLKKALDSR